MKENKSPRIYIIVVVLCLSIGIFFLTKLIDAQERDEQFLHSRTSSNRLSGYTIRRNDLVERRVVIEDLNRRIGSYHPKDVPDGDVVVELKDLVREARERYSALFKDYQDAINIYDRMSADFDSELRNGASRDVLKELDKQRLEKATYVLATGQMANAAYIELMAQYDAFVPKIMDKYFSGARQ